MMMMTGRYNIVAGDMHEYFATEKFRRLSAREQTKRSVLSRVHVLFHFTCSTI